MNPQYLEYCKKEIQEYLDKGLIRPSKSPWSCSAFYVLNAAELERGAPRLVINYKPLNKVLKWIRYPLPNKQDLIKRITHATIFSKFDMKSGYYQIGVKEEDKYKTSFNVPFGHYEWNVLPFGLKNAPSEYQNIMNDIFYPYMKFALVYLYDVLIFSNSINQHIEHLKTFINLVKENGLVVSAKKIKIFSTKIRF
uniref:Polyprotein n=1 Tax=Cajanus cajan TaxID=3821 RepID=A0A151SVY7_CAJCA|nr:polyprotein [Cajanus cajan]